MCAKWNSFIAFWITIFLCGCHEGNNDKAANSQNTNGKFGIYKIRLKDSIRVNYVGKLLPVDYNKLNNNLLFFDISAKMIVETDANGRILNAFSAKGESEKDYGASLSNIGYFEDTCIVVSGNMGYCFYKSDGTFLKKVNAKNGHAHAANLMGGERIREIDVNGQSVLISWFFKDFLMDNKSKQYYEQNRMLTFYNLEKEKYNLEIGYEPESIFRKYDYSYSTGRFTYFDVNYKDKSLYVINTPDTKIYKYSLEDGDAPQLVNVIDSRLKYFKLPYKVAFGSKNADLQKIMSVNSTLSTINSIGDFSMITYHTLLPEDVYAKSHSMEELGKAWEKYHKCYAVLFENDVQVSADVELPSICGDVAFLKSLDYIFMKTNTDISEPTDYSMFYIGSFAKEK